jgi:hypothetical protein|tara:strand:+ start:353 stop:733 length:381 start_codon:yes stop_codon:yes gene_type:complete
MSNEPLKTDENGERDEKGRFTQGNLGGPGRPKGLSITALIKEELEKIPEGQKKTYAELLTRRLLKKAIQEGDHPTQKMIWNYIDGMPQANLDVTSDNKPIFIPSEIMDKYDLNESTEGDSQEQGEV